MSAVLSNSDRSLAETNKENNRSAITRAQLSQYEHNSTAASDDIVDDVDKLDDDWLSKF